ncbi:dipeptidase 1-like [Schistocerca americana]|uniref:dipeptidase 1-like n=1 Tax=Schistocerca americana TaxID=7009 RepID=UPI001F4FCBB7|nr:dipeptidase 1-like [Schistocerca americana]
MAALAVAKADRTSSAAGPTSLAGGGRLVTREYKSGPQLAQLDNEVNPGALAPSLAAGGGRRAAALQLISCRRAIWRGAPPSLPSAFFSARLLVADAPAVSPGTARILRLNARCPLCRHNDLPWNIRKFARNRLANLSFGLDLRAVRPWAASAWSHTDLPRLRAGQVAAQFWAAYVPCESQYRDAVQLTLEQVDVVRRLTARHAPPLAFCTSAADIESTHQAGRICSLVGVEGGHSLGGSLSVLRTLYAVGVRYLTLTSTCNTPWADCSLVDNPGQRSENKGLTKFGKVVVREMNRLGMMVDLSHVSVRTMEDALAASRAPVIFSHSSARALCNSSRNVPDSVLRKVALNRGLVMVNFYSRFLTCSQDATVADAAAHIEHVRRVAGVDSVGLGAGYDGINSTPRGLEDASAYPALFAHLLATGRWSEADLRKLAGLNMLRVMRAAEQLITINKRFQLASGNAGGAGAGPGACATPPLLSQVSVCSQC